MSIDTVCQLMIFLLSAPAIWLVGRLEPWKRWGYIFGLASQPFWFYTTIKEGQWGIILLGICYTYSWLQGIRNYWFKT